MQRHPFASHFLALIGAALFSARNTVLPSMLGAPVHPSTVGYTGSSSVRRARGNGSARVQRAALKRRNVLRNRRNHK